MPRPFLKETPDCGDCDTKVHVVELLGRLLTENVIRLDDNNPLAQSAEVLSYETLDPCLPRTSGGHNDSEICIVGKGNAGDSSLVLRVLVLLNLLAYTLTEDYHLIKRYSLFTTHCVFLVESLHLLT